LDRLRGIEFSREQQAECMSYPLDLLFGEAASPKPDRVLAVAPRVIANGARVWQRVLDHHRVASDESVLPDSAELMHARISADRRVVFDKHVTGERRSVAEDDIAADVAIVRNMRMSHEQVVRANLGQASATVSSAVQRREFAKRIALARDKTRWLAGILEVLGRLTG